MIDSATSRLAHFPSPMSRSAYSDESRVTSASVPRPALLRAGPVVGLTPNHTSAPLGRPANVVVASAAELTDATKRPPGILWQIETNSSAVKPSTPSSPARSSGGRWLAVEPPNIGHAAKARVLASSCTRRSTGLGVTVVSDALLSVALAIMVSSL